MSRLIQYSGLATKIKGMESHLFQPKDYEELSNQSSVSGFLQYLKNLPQYQSLFSLLSENNVHRIELEQILKSSVLVDFIKIYQFANPKQKKLLSIFSTRFETDVLKQVLVQNFDHKKVDLTVLKKFGLPKSQLNLELLSNSDSLELFLEAIKDTPYYDSLKALSVQENVSLYDYESRLDVEYFIRVFHFASKLKQKKDREIMTAMLGTQIDYQNILWIYRYKRFYEVPETSIMNHIIPEHYRLTAPKLYGLVSASSLEEFRERLSNTPYGYLINSIHTVVLEHHFFTLRESAFKRIKNQYPFSIACVLYYLFEKELETERLTMVLEGIRYEMKPTDIIRYLSSNFVEDAT